MIFKVTYPCKTYTPIFECKATKCITCKIKYQCYTGHVAITEEDIELLGEDSATFVFLAYYVFGSVEQIYMNQFHFKGRYS